MQAQGGALGSHFQHFSVLSGIETRDTGRPSEEGSPGIAQGRKLVAGTEDQSRRRGGTETSDLYAVQRDLSCCMRDDLA